jgi:hypothetical protein
MHHVAVWEEFDCQGRGTGEGRKGTRGIVKAWQVRDSRLVVARVQRRGAETGVVSVGRGTWDVGHGTWDIGTSRGQPSQAVGAEGAC